MALQECEAVIKFVIPKEKTDLLYDAVAAMKKLGVTFDTGGCIDGSGNLCYDWEFDWSLKGPIKVYFKKFKEKDQCRVKSAKENFQTNQEVKFPGVERSRRYEL